LTGDFLLTILLVLGAFWLGACPFSLWVGQWFLGKDIRAYGDGNPGAANVFRAGNLKPGSLAIVLDIAKGMPFVYLSHSLFGLPEIATATVAVAAILGHAFSPMLGFRGGKAVAVTFGALIALFQPDLLLIFTIFIIIGFLILEDDAWKVMLAPTGSLAYMTINGISSGRLILMSFILVIFAFKHLEELKTLPRPKKRLVQRLYIKRR